MLNMVSWISRESISWRGSRRSPVLVAAGLEHATDIQIDEDDSTPFLPEVMMEEGRNSVINRFITKLFGYLGNNGVEVVLIKGQGVAQCYERPLWRTVGDVDLFLDEEN